MNGPRAVAVVRRGQQVLARYFEMTGVVGTPELSGPELEDHGPDNRAVRPGVA